VAVAYRDSVSGGGNLTSVSLTIPATVAANDGMVAAFTYSAASAPITHPAGWTVVSTATTGSLVTALLSRVAQAGDAGASATWTVTGAAARIAAAIVAYSGTDTTTLIDASASATSTTTPTTPTVAAVTAGAIEVQIVSQRGGTTGNWTPPGGITERQDIAVSGGGGQSLAVGDSLTGLASGASAGGGAWTPAVSTTTYTMWTVLLRAASTATNAPASEAAASASAQGATASVRAPAVAASAAASANPAAGPLQGPSSLAAWQALWDAPQIAGGWLGGDGCWSAMHPSGVSALFSFGDSPLLFDEGPVVLTGDESVCFAGPGGAYFIVTTAESAEWSVGSHVRAYQSDGVTLRSTETFRVVDISAPSAGLVNITTDHAIPGLADGDILKECTGGATRHFPNSSAILWTNDGLRLASGPGPLFPNDGDGSWYWAGPMLIENGSDLYVFASKQSPPPIPNPLGLPWTDEGHGLFRFTWADPLSAPVFAEKIADIGPAIGWGAAAVSDGTHAYIFGAELGFVSNRLYLARVPIGSLGSAPSTWEFWTSAGGGTWATGAENLTSSAGLLAVLSDSPGVENSLSAHLVGGQYRLVSKAAGTFGSDITVWTASAPAGPWAQGTVFGRAPYGSPTAEDQTYITLGHYDLPKVGQQWLVSTSRNQSGHTLAGYFEDGPEGFYRPLWFTSTIGDAAVAATSPSASVTTATATAAAASQSPATAAAGDATVAVFTQGSGATATAEALFDPGSSLSMELTQLTPVAGHVAALDATVVIALSTDAPADPAAATAEALSADGVTASITPSPALASVAAPDAAAAVAVAAPAETAGVLAQAIAVTSATAVTALPGAAVAGAAAGDAAASAGASADPGEAAGSADDPALSLSQPAPAEGTAATAEAFDAAAQISTPSTPLAAAAQGGGSAHDAATTRQDNIAAPAEDAPAATVAGDGAATVAPSAEATESAGAAGDATVTTSGAVLATAGAGTAAAGAPDPGPAVAVAGGAASASGAAVDAGASLSPSVQAANSEASAAALDAIVSSSGGALASAETAEAASAASGPTVATGTTGPASPAVAAGDCPDPGAALIIAAAEAITTAAALDTALAGLVSRRFRGRAAIREPHRGRASVL
jgi:trimeric autotransporter adhesin